MYTARLKIHGKKARHVEGVAGASAASLQAAALLWEFALTQLGQSESLPRFVASTDSSRPANECPKGGESESQEKIWTL